MKDIDRAQRDALVISIKKALAKCTSQRNVYATIHYKPEESKAQAALRHLARQLNNDRSEVEREQFTYRVRNYEVVFGPPRPDKDDKDELFRTDNICSNA
jgi:hypothetical protein